jgi:FixJ family two-component response regulator
MDNGNVSAHAGNLTKGQYDKYRSIVNGKSWQLSPQDKEDIFHDLCRGAVEAVKRGASDSLERAISSHVFYKTGEKCKARRQVSRRETPHDPQIVNQRAHQSTAASQVSGAVRDLADLPANTLSKFHSLDPDSVDINGVLDSMVDDVRRDNAAAVVQKLIKEIPADLMRVGLLRSKGYSNARISKEMGIKPTTVQYRWEELLRRARTIVGDLGLSSLTDLENRHFRLVA